MADSRTYVRLHDGLPDHPKVIAVGGEAAWLYVSALCYASRHLTDGVVPKALVPRLTDSSRSEASASALVRVGLWHEGEHDCPECPPASADEYVVHDYLNHQRSAAEVAEVRSKRSAAGQKGGQRSGQSRRAAAEAKAKREASAEANAKQARSKNEAETETETEINKEEKTATSSAQETPPRADVERVCKHLADRLVEGGSKRPAITKAWREAARLLLDRDGVTVDQALKAIDWAHANDFWQAHILTPKKLREKYETLRRQATAQHRPPASATAGGLTDDQWAAALERARIADARAAGHVQESL